MRSDAVLLLLGLSCAGCWGEPWPDDRVPLCEDSCRYAHDGECDDGGPGALYSVCDYGTDCGDCGVRGGGMPLLLDRRGTAEDCPSGCLASEACARELGCIPRCSATPDCTAGCCTSLGGGERGCAPLELCE